MIGKEAQIQIENLIEEIEGSSSAEVVVAIDRYSSDYLLYRLVVCAWIAFFPAGILSLFIPELTKKIPGLPWDDSLLTLIHSFTELSVAFLITWIFYKLSGSLFLKWGISIVPKSIRTKASHEKALQRFYSEELYKTQNHGGFLIHFSEAEKTATLLADKGLMVHLSQDQLDSFAEKIAETSKARQPETGVLECLRALKPIFHDKFPPAREGKPKNELSNKVRFY